MLRRFGHWMLVAALLAAIGGHWALLQSFAWATMLADNLQTHSVTESIERTFDGKHPCRCCRAIAAGRQTEKRPETEFPGVKLKQPDLAWERSCFVFVPPADFHWLPAFEATADSLSHAPLLPPPRSTAA